MGWERKTSLCAILTYHSVEFRYYVNYTVWGCEIPLIEMWASSVLEYLGNMKLLIQTLNAVFHSSKIKVNQPSRIREESLDSSWMRQIAFVVQRHYIQHTHSAWRGGQPLLSSLLELLCQVAVLPILATLLSLLPALLCAVGTQGTSRSSGMKNTAQIWGIVSTIFSSSC